MAFNFGSSTGFATSTTSAPSFGLGAGTSTTANKSGFGSTNFSSFNLGGTSGTGFGNLGATQPAATGFGSLASSAPATGTGFGGFSSGFGASTATTSTLTSGTSFGTGTGFSGFGTAPTSTTQSGFGGFGTFSQPATTSAPGSLFSGFGQTSTTGTGFGQSATNTGFGQPATNTGFGQPATNTGFGQPATNTGFGGFGSTFGAKTAPTITTGGFGGFGSSSFGQGLSLQPQQQPGPQQVPANPNEALYNSIFHCTVYGDERDTVLARWNLLQALWGSGKAFYSNNAAPVEITQQNPFCRFKAVGYSCIPEADNKDGLVAIIFNKAESEITAQKAQLVSSLSTVLGNKPNLAVTVESIKPMSEVKSQVVMYLVEKTSTGSTRRVPAPELTAFLLQPMQKQQLTSMGVENVFPHTAIDKETIQAYLDTPPAGIDPRLWKQAQLDNPDSSKYLPVPMVGFAEVRWRMRCQEQETRLHQAFLDRVADDIAQLRTQQGNTVAKVAEYKRKFAELQHRLIKVLVRQEVRRKLGMALQPEEDVLRSQLESLESQLNDPTQYKGRLNEMLSLMRMQRHEAAHRDVPRYSLDPTAKDHIKQFLALEQNGLAHLIDTVQADLGSLKIIKEGMTRLLQGH